MDIGHIWNLIGEFSEVAEECFNSLWLPWIFQEMQKKQRETP